MRLELISGTSKKFWEIDLSDRSFTARWGRIGTDGQAKQQKFKTAAEAKRAHDKLVAEKLAKGYTNAKGATVVASPRNAALEAAIRADRDDPGPTVVYADWLQAQGSAIGELIVLSQGKPDAKKKKRTAAILAGLDLPGEKLATYGWRWGLWQWLRLENLIDWMDANFDPIALARGLFAQPMAAALDELRIGILRWDFNHKDVPAVLAEAGKHAWAAELQRLHLGDVSDDIDMAHHVIGDIGAVISKAFPQLTSLKLHSGSQEWRGEGETFGIGKLDLPELTELVIETCSMSKKRLGHLLTAKLPKLERLELWFGSKDQGVNCTVKDLAPLLGGKVFPKLRSLGLRNCEFADQLPAALRTSAIAPRLESLDLSMGCLTDQGATELATSAPVYKKLESLSVDDGFLTPAGIRQVKAAFKGKTVISKEQKDVDDSVEGEIYRFVSVSE